ncbi:MAG: hypothetical protein ABI696_07405 [Rubrivivax sp.]
MNSLDVVWHLLNLFAVAALTGLITSSAVKALWWRELAGVAWRRLAAWAVGACAAVSVGGLVLLGQDGRIVTYGVMVAVCALTLWWQGFGRRGGRR